MHSSKGCPFRRIDKWCIASLIKPIGSGLKLNNIKMSGGTQRLRFSFYLFLAYLSYRLS